MKTSNFVQATPFIGFDKTETPLMEAGTMWKVWDLSLVFFTLRSLLA